MSSMARPADEKANLATHGFGLLLSLAAAPFLLRSVLAAGNQRISLACGVYCLTLVTLYAASTLSHAFHDINRRRFFRTFDQVSIFFMIAGSFTPFAVGFLSRGWWWALLPAMWIMAFAGAAFVLRRRDLSRRAKFAYAALGILAVISFRELYQVAPLNMLRLLVAGLLFYSAGTIFLALGKTTRYFHSLWHLFVLAGSACHYAAIAVYIAAR
ncbi:MAG: hemolysin III family protein [Elusimicrobiota bacterium]|nr:hemolysin III family protein [Elusimicrobiota bacterium]